MTANSCVYFKAIPLIEYMRAKIFRVWINALPIMFEIV